MDNKTNLDYITENLYALLIAIILEKTPEEAFDLIESKKLNKKKKKWEWNKSVTNHDVLIAKQLKETYPQMSYKEILDMLGIQNMSVGALKKRIIRLDMTKLQEKPLLKAE